ncbi:ImmA/IrrE family metallo-endopeptidase [Alkalicaulis satelles]|uniref:ImmA/IrrE family metallo-endopeptidase n=1 Tax=Alkalicaulis satelles TaxID=2609175 RepID=A0A5M6ZET3_9PROT|nr:short-chain fatty acyl-CoA regulator family protein [Alkalicaulis satelles]KAA5801608.1 ImmA/IrrE family metallo-endopeptidase [Alkalicaulis satelles]
MAEALEKLFAGARLRRLRRDMGQSQAQFAESLGVSASYLNLLERNQRPVTARVLLALAEAFDIDVRAFAAESDRQLLADLKEAASDPVLKGADLDQRDLTDLADAHPRAAEALARLYQAYRETSAAAADLALRAEEGLSGTGLSALEEVRDALDAAQNHFPSLETGAEALRADLPEAVSLEAALAARLKSAHGAAVRVYDDSVMAGALRRYDFHARKLLLSDLLSPSARAFHIAVTLVQLEMGEALDAEAARPPGLSAEARALYRASLANYAAAAVLMPYDAFFRAAESARYDMDVLRRRFSASHEQVCHRLTTLNRPGARGIAFFMIRVDQAGNIAKRFGGGVLAFARSGGGCVRWRLHDAFRATERVHVQGLELPDGARFISIARAVSRALPDGGSALSAIAVGCDAKEAGRLAYAPADFTPVGLSCRLCERSDCAERVLPPLQKSLRIDPHVRGAAPFAFAQD